MASPIEGSNVTRKDTSKLRDNRPQILVKPNDINQSLRDNEFVKEDEFTKKYERAQITVMDRTLSDVLDKTLNFVVQRKY